MDSSSFYGKRKVQMDDENESSSDEYLPSEESDDSEASSSQDDTVIDEEALDDEESLDETDNEYDDNISASDWGPVHSKPRSFPFTGKEQLSLDASTLTSPIDWYDLFFTNEIVDHIVAETNRYAQQKIGSSHVTRRSRLKSWKVTTHDEIRKLIGLMIYMGIVTLPEVSLYWSKKKIYVGSFASRVMSRERFELLMRFLHLNDNTYEEASTDSLFKIRPFIDAITDRFQTVYKPGSELVIDESMVPFRGRVKIRQYVPGKAHKYGLKLYKVCTPEAYTWNFEVHTGEKKYIQGLNHTEALTVTLFEKLLNQGATIFSDNFYSSVVLAEYLLKEKTYLCGTIRKNRKRIPNDVKNAKLQRKEMKALENEKGVKVFNWRDKRYVLTISSVPEHGAVLCPSGKKDRKGEEILKPESVLAYNKVKKGVDVSDQMTSYYTALRKTRKWYRKLFVELLTGEAVVNAFVLCKKYGNQNNLSLLEFRECLVYSLTGEEKNTPKPGKEATTIAGKRSCHALCEADGPKSKTRKRCRGCYEKISLNEGCKIARQQARRVSTFCPQCEGNPHLCVTCFAEKHAEGN